MQKLQKRSFYQEVGNLRALLNRYNKEENNVLKPDYKNRAKEAIQTKQENVNLVNKNPGNEPIQKKQIQELNNKNQQVNNIKQSSIVNQFLDKKDNKDVGHIKHVKQSSIVNQYHYRTKSVLNAKVRSFSVGLKERYNLEVFNRIITLLKQYNIISYDEFKLFSSISESQITLFLSLLQSFKINDTNLLEAFLKNPDKVSLSKIISSQLIAITDKDEMIKSFYRFIPYNTKKGGSKVVIVKFVNGKMEDIHKSNSQANNEGGFNSLTELQSLKNGKKTLMQMSNFNENNGLNENIKDRYYKIDKLRKILHNEGKNPDEVFVKHEEVANGLFFQEKASCDLMNYVAKLREELYHKHITINEFNSKLQEVFFEVSRLLEILHSVGIAHNDFKPENIVVFVNKNKEISLRVIDLDSAVIKKISLSEENDLYCDDGTYRFFGTPFFALYALGIDGKINNKINRFFLSLLVDLMGLVSTINLYCNNKFLFLEEFLHIVSTGEYEGYDYDEIFKKTWSICQYIITNEIPKLKYNDILKYTQEKGTVCMREVLDKQNVAFTDLSNAIQGYGGLAILNSVQITARQIMLDTEKLLTQYKIGSKENFILNKQDTKKYNEITSKLKERKQSVVGGIDGFVKNIKDENTKADVKKLIEKYIDVLYSNIDEMMTKYPIFHSKYRKETCDKFEKMYNISINSDIKQKDNYDKAIENFSQINFISMKDQEHLYRKEPQIYQENNGLQFYPKIDSSQIEAIKGKLNYDLLDKSIVTKNRCKFAEPLWDCLLNKQNNSNIKH